MTQVSLKQFVERAMKGACRVFEQTGAVPPMYHAVTTAGKQIAFNAPPGDKDTSVNAVRAYLASLDTVRVAFIAESWTLEEGLTRSEVDELYRQSGGVRSHPNRIEAIVILGEDLHEPTVYAMRKIFRRGNRAVLGALDIYTPTEMEGRMTTLLPRKDTVQ